MLKDETTADLQYDLAMSYAAHDAHPLTRRLEKELRRRHAPLPTQCRWEYDPYGRFKKTLKFDLME